MCVLYESEIYRDTVTVQVIICGDINMNNKSISPRLHGSLSSKLINQALSGIVE